MDVILVRVQPNGKQQKLPITRAETIFGRGKDCKVRIPISKVSRHHCKLVVSADGHITIADLGSSNGIFVNQDRVEQANLSGGDLISFGGLVFVVQVNGDPAEIDAELSFEDGIPDEASHVSAPAPSAAEEPPPPPQRESLVPAGDMDGSSMSEFEFDFNDDDDDEQPPL